MTSYEVSFSEDASSLDGVSLAESASEICDSMTALSNPPSPVGAGSDVQFRIPGLWPGREYGVCVRYVSDGVTSDPAFIVIDTKL